ncbi:MAG TPA: flavin reductase family protein [Stellaceae bacterium]|jgi:flavin reductase (DIM6/NTAB) family NADH-FMN oxidoreductase RutF|nr:flavin reductase family protein [Stellaceae bacterium]
MFYEPDKNDHGLKHDPFKSIVVPRPIGWISSLSAAGKLNLAPFSQFNNLGYDPPYVMFAAANFPRLSRPKDSVSNVIETGEFVVNMATYALREAINITSSAVEPDIDEAALAGLAMEPSVLVKPPRVAASPVHLECRYHCMLALPGRNLEQSHYVVVGRVIGVHIRDEVLTPDGRVDILKIRPLARLGYHDYTSVESLFTMTPIGPGAELRKAGLEGRPVPPPKAK